MLQLPLCLLLLSLLSSYTLSQTSGDDIPIVKVSEGRIFLPSATSTSVCSTITTTIGELVDYIPVPCVDISHAPIWSEKVLVDGTTAELIIAPSGNVRFVSETWLNANLSTPISNRSTPTSSTVSKTTLSSYVSLNSSTSFRTSLEWARSSSPSAATNPTMHLMSASSASVASYTSRSTGSSYVCTSLGSGTSSTPMRTDSNPLNTASGPVTTGIYISNRTRPYQSAANTTSGNLTHTATYTWSSITNTEHSLDTTQSKLYNSSSTTLSKRTTLTNATSYYITISSTIAAPFRSDSASSPLQLFSSGSSFSSSSPNMSTSQSSYKQSNNAQATQLTASTSSTSSATMTMYSAASAGSPATSSFSSTPNITPPPKSSTSASGNFTPPISSYLSAFATSGSSLITLSMSGQSIVLTRQTMPGFAGFTGTTTITTSEATTNSAGAVAWATGAVIVGAGGVFWGLAIGSLAIEAFCIWPLCSGGGFCIWPFCGGTGGIVSGGSGGGDGDGDGNGNGDGGGGGDRDGDKNTKPNERTQEEKTQQESNHSNPATISSLPSSTPATTSSLPRSTTASTTASDPACPIFVIPSDSLTNDGSPTWNPNDPEYDGAIVPAAYAIWLIDSGSGTTEILPPLPSGTGYEVNTIPIGFIPGAGNGGGNSTNISTTSRTEETITPMPVMTRSSIVSTSAASSAALETSALSAEALQVSASAQSIVAVESKSLAVVEIVVAIQSQEAIENHISVQNVASVNSVSAASAASVASIASVASLPTPTPNLAIMIIRNDYCDVECSSTGYIYDIVPSSPNVPVCNNPPWVHTYDYPEDVSNDVSNYPVNSGKFTSHGSYTNCEYVGSNDFLGFFSCDQLEAVFCSLPTEPASSCTSSHSLDADEWVPIVYCEWVATTPTSTAIAAAKTPPVTCTVRTNFAGRGYVTGHECICSDGSKPAPGILNKEWTCPNEVAS